MVTRLGPTSTATRMAVTCVIVAIVVGALPGMASGLPVVVTGAVVAGCIGAGCLFFLRYRTSVRLTGDAAFVREWLIYGQYQRSDLQPEPATAAFRVLGIKGFVPVLTTHDGRSVRLWGLARKTRDDLGATLHDLERWLREGRLDDAPAH